MTNLTVTTHSANAKPVTTIPTANKLTILQAKAHSHYEIVNPNTRIAPYQLSFERIGDDIHIRLQDGDVAQPDIIIADYFKFEDQDIIGLNGTTTGTEAYFSYISDAGIDISQIPMGDAQLYQLGGDANPHPWWSDAAEALSVSDVGIFMGALALEAAAVKLVTNSGDNDNDDDSYVVASSNQAPILTVTKLNELVEDNTQAGTVVANFNINDADGDNVSVSINDSPYYELANVDPQSGTGNVVLTQAGSELVNSGETLPQFILTPSDGETEGETTVIPTNEIITTPVNDPPTIPQSPPPVELIEGEAKAGEVITQVDAVDEDSDSLTYSLNNTDGLYTINDSGVITLTQAGANQVNSGNELPSISITVTDDSNATNNSTTIMVDVPVIPDTTAPTATITLDNTTLITGETGNVSITFSEAVQDLELDDFSATNATLSNLQSSSNGITWTAILTPTANTQVSNNNLTLADSYTDVAGNTGTTAQSTDYIVDTIAPTASITIDDTTLTTGDTANVTITFTEAVQNLEVSDFSTPGAELNTLQTSDSGITWSAKLTPIASTETSGKMITLSSNYTDLAGNAGMTAQSEAYKVDTKAPTLSVTEINYLENQVATETINGTDVSSTLGTVSANDLSGVKSYAFVGGNTNADGVSTSSDGFFTIDTAGNIKLTEAGGVLAAGSTQPSTDSHNDFESLENAFNYQIVVTDINNLQSVPVNVTFNVKNVLAYDESHYYGITINTTTGINDDGTVNTDPAFTTNDDANSLMFGYDEFGNAITDTDLVNSTIATAAGDDTIEVTGNIASQTIAPEGAPPSVTTFISDIDMGAGNDTLVTQGGIITTDQYETLSPVEIATIQNIDMGDGDDTINARTIMLKGQYGDSTLNLDMGDDNDTLVIEEAIQVLATAANGIDTSINAVIDMGDGDNSFQATAITSEGTTTNSDTNASVNLSIISGSGHDTYLVASIDLSSDDINEQSTITIDTGAGNDSFANNLSSLSSVSYGGNTNISIDLGEGDNSLGYHDSVYSTRTYNGRGSSNSDISMGAGVDIIKVHDLVSSTSISSVDDNEILDGFNPYSDISVNTGGGSDDIEAMGIQAYSRLTNLESDNSIIESQVSIATEAGDDSLVTSYLSARAELYVPDNANSNYATITDTFVNSAVDINMGDGNDTLEITKQLSLSHDVYTQVGLGSGVNVEMNIDMGNGNDNLSINKIYSYGEVDFSGTDSVKTFAIDLGTGDDTLTLGRITVSDSSLAYTTSTIDIHGGDGIDTLVLGGADPDVYLRLGVEYNDPTEDSMHTTAIKGFERIKLDGNDTLLFELADLVDIQNDELYIDATGDFNSVYLDITNFTISSNADYNIYMNVATGTNVYIDKDITDIVDIATWSYIW